MYLGKNNAANTFVQLATNKLQNEVLILEPRGNGEFAIKSQANTYLCMDGNKAKWFNQPTNSSIWTFKPVNGGNNNNSNQGFNFNTNTNTNQGFNSNGVLSNGNVVYISHNGNYIGGIKNEHNDLQLVKHEQDWEKWTV